MSKLRKWPKRITLVWPEEFICPRTAFVDAEPLVRPSERREYVLVTRKRVRK